jgi:hypothetical protein
MSDADQSDLCLRFLVLGCGGDDWEDLEQLYLSLSLEFSAERYDPSNPDAYYWRESHSGPRLSDIADTVLQLIREGLLSARSADGEEIRSIERDLSLVWKGWFRTTDAGRRVVEGITGSDSGQSHQS